MRQRHTPVGPVTFFLFSFGLTLAVLASVRVDKPVPLEPIEDLASARQLNPESFSTAVQAFRRGDYPAARTELERMTLAGVAQAPVIQGLYAHQLGLDQEAFDVLGSVETYRGELADWRLWALGEAAHALDRKLISQAVLLRLLNEYPDSPLRSRAVELLALHAVEHDDWLGLLDLVDATYDSRLSVEIRALLARLSWDAGEALDSSEIRRTAARRVLVDHPLLAPELDVVEMFRQPDGDVLWADFLSTTELIERGRSLLDVNLPESAIDTLAEVAESERSFAWHIVQAKALTADRRGSEALSTLEAVDGTTPAEQDQLAWERAHAAIEASTPRRGRGHVTSQEREEMRQLAHRQLRLVAEGDDQRLARRALRILFEDLFEDERFDDSLVVLRRLLVLDSHDTTGARALWGRGWKAYSDRNYTGAIGYWTVLGELYPRTNYNRSALYWSARGHQKLGNDERAQELFKQVTAVDFTDLYRRHALGRLSNLPLAANESEAAPTEPWPEDPSLARAERLYQLGLDDAAILDLESLSSQADHRALQALKARVLAAAGDRRQSILALRQAFPILGTPHQGLAPEEARRLYYPLDFKDVIEEHSRNRRLPSHLVFGMIRQESAFDASAKSWAGARGLMQIMPSTGKELARRLGLRYSQDRLSDPEFSIQLGTSYFQQVLKMFSGDEVLALAGYNAGPYRIKRLWRQAGSNAEIDQFLEQLSYSETRNYVKRVLLYSDSYRRLYEASG